MNKKPSSYRDDIHRIADAVDGALVAAVHRMDENADIDLDGIIISLAEARAYIVHATLMASAIDRIIDVPHDAPRVYADELIDLPKPKPKALPALVPVKGVRVGIMNKLKHVKDYDCPSCGAKAGTMCFKMDRAGKGGRPTAERHPPESKCYHHPRAALSRAHNDKIRREYDRAVSKSPTGEHNPNERNQ